MKCSFMNLVLAFKIKPAFETLFCFSQRLKYKYRNTEIKLGEKDKQTRKIKPQIHEKHLHACIMSWF